MMTYTTSTQVYYIAFSNAPAVQARKGYFARAGLGDSTDYPFLKRDYVEIRKTSTKPKTRHFLTLFFT